MKSYLFIFLCFLVLLVLYLRRLYLTQDQFIPRSFIVLAPIFWVYHPFGLKRFNLKLSMNVISSTLDNQGPNLSLAWRGGRNDIFPFFTLSAESRGTYLTHPFRNRLYMFDSGIRFSLLIFLGWKQGSREQEFSLFLLVGSLTRAGSYVCRVAGVQHNLRGW